MSKGSSPRPFSVDRLTFGNNYDTIFGKNKQDKGSCHCYNCTKATDPDYVLKHMIVCPTCGNKRCPHSTDHTLNCTGSNEPGQPGSRY
jgi:Zn finger protein HypA/HybF involved in hydrogenase expression